MNSRTVQESAADLGDKPCIYCGYNLRGLTAADRCPECGKLAVDSLLGDNLRDAESSWLRTILRGLKIIAVAYMVWIVDELATIAQYLVMRSLGPYHEAHGFFFYQRFVAMIALVGVGVGLWLVTTREQSDALIARRRGLAWLLRIGMILALVAHFFPIAVPIDKVPVMAWRGLMWAGSIGEGVVHALVWWTILRIINRTPRREVARLLKVMIGVSIPLFILASEPVLTWVALNVDLTNMGHAWPCIVLVVLPTLMVLHHAFAAFLSILSGKAIRRTIGDWT